MTVDDHAALVALGKKMAATNGYTAMQSSSLYVTDGDEIDWAYGHEHIFMYTFEMYPSHSQVSSTARFYPPDEVIAPQTERNKAAILTLIEAAGCPYGVIGKAKAELRPAVRRLRDVRRLDRQPARHRYGQAGAWQRGNPATTTRQAGTCRPVGGARHGSRGRHAAQLLRHRRRRHDRPLAPDRAAGAVGPLTFRYYLAHSSNSSIAGLLPGLRRGRRRVADARPPGARRREHRPAGVGTAIDPDDALGRADGPDRVRGRRPRGASTVEAAVDDVRITRP